MEPDEGAHSTDPELRELTLRFLAVNADDPDSEQTAELLDAYMAAVERRRGELHGDPERLERLEMDHAFVVLDAGEATDLDAWSRLEAFLPTAIDELRRLAREAPDEETREAARRTLVERGFSPDEDPS